MSYIDIYVSSGGFSSPYYNFYTDDAGTQELSNNTLYLNQSYRFYRLNNAGGHAFYISDQGYEQAASSNITLGGDGSATSGITGTQSFTLEFSGLTTTDTLQYYCTAHSSMIGSFNLEETDPSTANSSIEINNLNTHSVQFNNSNVDFDLIAFSDISGTMNETFTFKDIFYQKGFSGIGVDCSAIAFIDVSASDYTNLFKLNIPIYDPSSSVVDTDNVRYLTKADNWKDVSFSDAIVDVSAIFGSHNDQSIKKDMVRSMLLDITGTTRMNNLFKNQNEMSRNIQNLDSSFNTNIKTLLSAIEGAGWLTDEDYGVLMDGSQNYTFDTIFDTYANESTYMTDVSSGYHSLASQTQFSKFNPLRILSSTILGEEDADYEDEYINIYVSSGGFSSPYYNFYTDDAGTQELNNNTLYLNQKYRFYRLNNAGGHAFYISDQGYEQAASSNITLGGDGSTTSGITGTQSFTLEFSGLTTTDTLQYYCTAHSSMIGSFNLSDSNTLSGSGLGNINRRTTLINSLQSEVEQFWNDISATSYVGEDSNGTIYNVYFNETTAIASGNNYSRENGSKFSSYLSNVMLYTDTNGVPTLDASNSLIQNVVDKEYSFPFLSGDKLHLLLEYHPKSSNFSFVSGENNISKRIYEVVLQMN